MSFFHRTKSLFGQNWRYIHLPKFFSLDVTGITKANGSISTRILERSEFFLCKDKILPQKLTLNNKIQITLIFHNHSGCFFAGTHSKLKKNDENNFEFGGESDPENK